MQELVQKARQYSCGLIHALLCRQLIPVTDNYKGDAFFTIENGKRVATPLLLVLAVVELSDVVFAVDSIPAVSLLSSLLDNFAWYVMNYHLSPCCCTLRLGSKSLASLAVCQGLLTAWTYCQAC